MKTLSPPWTVDSPSAVAASSPAKRLVMVVGYDGSLPARHALDQAANVLRYRDGILEVVYVAHLPVGASFAPEAFAEVRRVLDDQARVLAEEVGDRLAGTTYSWHFQRRDGAVAPELKAAAADVQRRYGDTAEVVIIVGGSSRRHHHLARSVGSDVVRSEVFPTLVVP